MGRPWRRWRLRFARAAWWLALLPLIASCSRREREQALDRQVALRAGETYARIAHAAYDDSVIGARALLAAIDALLASPSRDALTRAQDAWRDARIPYGQTEVFRFYDGPIEEVELLVNTWPIDENMVEAGSDADRRGIVDGVDAYPELSAELLVKLNVRDGETSVSTGYHVIELLLWGRDESDSGPGARTFDDFVPAADRPLVARRRRYLRLATALLIGHLEGVRDAWAPAADNYRARFVAFPPREALARMIKGAGTLSGPELAGERLTVPYETRDQENEHSCFSDNTQRDIVHNARGIQNVCLGRYTRSDGRSVDGTGLCAALATRDPALAQLLEAQIAASLVAAEAVPHPFDRALGGDDEAPGRVAIERTIRALERQAATLGRAAALLGIGVGAIARSGA